MNARSPQLNWTEVSDPTRLVKEPLVSVHMLTYNHEPYLAEAIRSVLQQQTGYPYELVIGEDCSTDRSRGIALEFQRQCPERIRVLHSDANVGWRLNLRRVDASCRGEYLAFCEGDDYWHDPQKLEKQVSFLESHPDYVMVHTAFNTQTGSTIHGHDPKVVTVPTDRVFERLLGGNFIATCTVCLRAATAAKYRASKFYAAEYLMGDYVQWLYASRQGLVQYLQPTFRPPIAGCRARSCTADWIASCAWRSRNARSARTSWRNTAVRTKSFPKLASVFPATS